MGWREAAPPDGDPPACCCWHGGGGASSAAAFPLTPCSSLLPLPCGAAPEKKEGGPRFGAVAAQVPHWQTLTNAHTRPPYLTISFMGPPTQTSPTLKSRGR